MLQAALSVVQLCFQKSNKMQPMQCGSGIFSASGASVCTACPAGKYLTNAAGGTHAGSCTNVSIDLSFAFGVLLTR